MVRKFDEIPLGYFIKQEAPVEYALILRTFKSPLKPSADFIEALGYRSTNPLFKKLKFRRALIKYRQTGLRSGVVYKPTVKSEKFYMGIRRNNNIPNIVTIL